MKYESSRLPKAIADGSHRSRAEVVPDAPKNIVAPNEPMVENRPQFDTQNDKLVDTPANTVVPAVPKLLPTPVSEQVSAPKFSDIPEPVADISDQLPVSRKSFVLPSDGPLSDALPAELPSTELPPAKETAAPEVPQQPLPDILVDPFIEDVGQSKFSSRSRVALVSSHEGLPVNALREGEPKRLSPSQKGIIAKELAAPRATRIIFKRFFDEKIEP